MCVCVCVCVCVSEAAPPGTYLPYGAKSTAPGKVSANASINCQT